MTNFLRNLFGSSLGKKYIMSISGFFLVLFIIGHVVGNLQIFAGPEMINRYGELLQSNAELLWGFRLAMLGIVTLHIWSAARLTIENRAARPVGYEEWSPVVASYASRTMMVGGIIIALFLIYHLLHYTALVQAVNLTGKNFNARPEFFDAAGRHDIYKMMVIGFRQPLVSLFYIVAVFFLALHLSHGVRAMFQSLGWKKRPYARFLDGCAIAVSIFVFVGFASIPIAILLGFGKEVVK